jgi:beta-lactamase class D
MAFILALPLPCHCEDADLAKLFTDRNVHGTIVLSSLDGSKSWVHDDERANTLFVPASTFKILNTLIALDAGVIDEHEVLKWDGKDRGVAAWNRDQTLETAFKSTCVWFYQELAKRIGKARYQKILAEVGYGTANPGPDLETFWLEGDLKISAAEQVEFLKRLYRKELPFRAASYDTLQKIMILEQKPTSVLRAKTGWAQSVSPQIGWFVGYVETGERTWFFALNMDIAKPEDTRYRQEITLEALKLKGVL